MIRVRVELGDVTLYCCRHAHGSAHLAKVAGLALASTSTHGRALADLGELIHDPMIHSVYSAAIEQQPVLALTGCI